jgi:D-3-phosphoglycerate dehydrogenase / 2-oxoglutarate reductase
MAKVIVTPRSLSKGGHPLLDRITSAGYELCFPSPGAQPTEAQLEAVIGDAVGYIAGVEKVGAPLLAKAKSLVAISRNGTGVDNVDLEAAKARGIRVLRAEGANARGVAELAFGHILAGTRGISSADRELKAEVWTREKGFELEGKKLALLGCGKIGKLVARFALAFDMKVVAYDLYPDKSFAPSPNFSWTRLAGGEGLAEALALADVVSLHCPPSPDGRPLLDAAVIASLKKGVVVVNTAREGLVDAAAMAAALDSGHVRAYAMDAFDKEPPEDWGLVHNPRAIATPHIGGFTVESVDRATEVAVDNLLAALKESAR